MVVIYSIHLRSQAPPEHVQLTNAVHYIFLGELKCKKSVCPGVLEAPAVGNILCSSACWSLLTFGAPRFMKESFDLAMWSPECNIIALVLITRLIGSTEITFNFNNWDKILLCSLLLAQKLWDDTPLANVDFPAIWQVQYCIPDHAMRKISTNFV
jgi:hypothetical protein